MCFGKLAKQSSAPIWPDELGVAWPQSWRWQRRHQCPCQTQHDCGIYKNRCRPRLENLGQQDIAQSPMEARHSRSIRPGYLPRAVLNFFFFFGFNFTQIFRIWPKMLQLLTYLLKPTCSEFVLRQSHYIFTT